MLKNNFVLLYLFILGLTSCQNIEILDDLVFDYNQFSKISVNVEEKIIKNLYEAKYANPYIDYSLSKPPEKYLNEWLESNIRFFGTENKIVINILDSSLKKTEIPNINSKKYEEKTIFLFEINYLVEFIVYDDVNSLIASTLVESRRTTTSTKYISIQENEKIIDHLIFDCLSDFTKKTEELIKIHLNRFVL